MTLTPNDIIEREFNLKLRGYDRDEVDAFLEECAGAMAAVIRERNTLKDQNIACKNKINGLLEKQNDVTEAITAVHKMAEDMKERAANEAELIVRKARIEADRIVSDAQKEALALEEKVMKLRQMQRETIIKTRTMIQGYLDMLDDAELHLPPEEFTTSMHSVAAGMREINRGESKSAGIEEGATVDTKKEPGSSSGEAEDIEAIVDDDIFISSTEVGDDIFLAEIREDSDNSHDAAAEDAAESADGDSGMAGFKPEKLMP